MYNDMDGKTSTSGEIRKAHKILAW